jgi:hypothetical protein
MNRTEHELELMRLYLEGVASLEETQELESLIVKDASVRQDFLRYTHLDSALAGVRRSQPSVVVPRRSVWLSWRPLTAAAAGIVFGVFCTSVVFAYAVPRIRMDRHRVVPLFNERFEDVKAVFGRGFPNDADGWSGDFDAVVSTDGAISPKEGQHMARLAPIAGRKFCAAERIVDLAKFPLTSSTESRMVEVTASFHGIDSEWPDRNQIRLAAFAEAPKDVKAIWNSDSRLDQVLQHLGRTVTVKPGEHGWQTLKVSMEIPTGARSLVIHLGAGVADDAGPKTLHYIDDVRAQFVITETTP